MKMISLTGKILPENVHLMAGGHVHPGDKPVSKIPPTWESAHEQRGFWGQAPGSCGYYTAWIEYKGEFYFPEDDAHGHRAALLAAAR